VSIFLQNTNDARAVAVSQCQCVHHETNAESALEGGRRTCASFQKCPIYHARGRIDRAACAWLISMRASTIPYERLRAIKQRHSRSSPHGQPNHGVRSVNVTREVHGREGPFITCTGLSRQPGSGCLEYGGNDWYLPTYLGVIESEAASRDPKRYLQVRH